MIEDNKSRKQEERRLYQKELTIFIILLLVIFLIMVFLDKKYPDTIEHRPFEGEVQTYDGSLQRNLSNPLGLE